MKSKPTLPQVLSLIFISCGILIGCKEANPTYSSPIQSTDADNLIKDYRNSNNVIKTFDKNGIQKDLVEFCFNAPDINEIINNNASNIKTVDQVAFYFGHEKNLKRWHLIAYGMIPPYNVPNTGGTLLDFSTIANRDASIFDSEVILPKPKKDAAATSRKYYKDDGPLQTFDKNNNPVPLYGFAFTATQINQLFGEKPDQIALDIGLEYVNGDTNKIRWHLVAYGMKNGAPIGMTGTATPKLLLPTNALYFDKADPCPPCN
jgi:hypothetical protein